MAKINDIKSIIQTAAAKTSIPEYNGNAALKIAEPVIPLPNKQVLQEPSSPSIPSTPVLPSQQQILQFIKNNFVENRDFMRIAGIPHPVMTKTGAVKVIRYLSLRPQVRLLNSVYDASSATAAYTIECTLVDKEGSPVVSAVGASSTAEKKYAKAGIDAINTVCNMAYKRALIAAVKLLL